MARSHGWFDLPPFAWDPAEDRLSYAFHLSDGRPVATEVEQATGVLRVTARAFGPLGGVDEEAIHRTVRRCLQLDLDLGPFYRAVNGHKTLDWVRRKHAGRMLRSHSLFEDLIKIMATTNCSWALTKVMITALVKRHGSKTPRANTFPSPGTLAQVSESAWRRDMSVGYRAPYFLRLCQQATTDGWLADLENPDLPTLDRKKRLLAIDGFGPYAAGSALRLMGDHSELAIDSWCRSTYRRMYPRAQATDRAIARRYGQFGTWAGLAFWMDLTRDWHEPSENR